MILTSPSSWLWLASALAVFAYALPVVAPRFWSDPAAKRLLWLAWLAHAASLLGMFTTPVRFGFAPAMSVTAWLVLTAHLIERRYYPQLKARWAMGGLGAVCVLLAQGFPGAPLHVQASPWLPLHWALGLSAYGLFAAAVVHAWMMTLTEREIRLAQASQNGLPLLTLERLTFRFVTAGFVLLSATLLAGLLFGEHLYGPGTSPWRWDHKRIFALLSWLTFALLLWGRTQWGWRGKRAVRVLYIGATLLLLSYAGSRFVLEIMLGRSA